MRFRQLGKTGIEVSVLGLGSSPFRFGTTKECAMLIEQAYEAGITYYDTSRSYINGEEPISLLPEEVKNGLVIATKTGARGGKRCISDLLQSLKAMKRDYVDVWMTHMVETEEEYDMCTELGGFCDLAEAAKKAGIVRATGASFHAPTHVILKAIKKGSFDIVMFQMNIIGRETVFGSSISSYINTLLPAAKENGVGVVIMKALAGGELQNGAPLLKFLSRQVDAGDTAAGAVLYPTLHPSVSTVVVGMRSTAEILRNSTVISEFGGDELATFNQWTRKAEKMRFSKCNRCGDCLHVCPQRIEIPKIIRLFEQFACFGMTETARHKYGKLENSAVNCTACHECERVCHLHLNLPSVLAHAHRCLT
jgi:predicted aldo/keto reductase-like oxidoreductase